MSDRVKKLLWLVIVVQGNQPSFNYLCVFMMLVTDVSWSESVTEAEGHKRSVELNADAELYAAEQSAKARRIQADAEAYATAVVAEAISKNGIEAAQYQVALKQVEALTAVGTGPGKQTILLPAAALEAFGDAFQLFAKGKV